MDDLSSMINNVLNDPEAMSKIQSIAQSLNLGGEGDSGKSRNSGNNQNTNMNSDSGGAGLDAESILGITRAVKTLSCDNESIQLLKALKPFFSEKRAKKVDDAIKIMGLLKLLPILKEGRLSSILGGGK